MVEQVKETGGVALEKEMEGAQRATEISFSRDSVTPGNPLAPSGAVFQLLSSGCSCGRGGIDIRCASFLSTP